MNLSSQVLHALCQKGLHASVRHDKVGVHVYDIEFSRIFPHLPHLEPGQVALEIPGDENVPSRIDAYDVNFLLELLSSVPAWCYADEGNGPPDQPEWSGVQSYLEDARMAPFAQDLT